MSPINNTSSSPHTSSPFNALTSITSPYNTSDEVDTNNIQFTSPRVASTNHSTVHHLRTTVHSPSYASPTSLRTTTNNTIHGEAPSTRRYFDFLKTFQDKWDASPFTTVHHSPILDDVGALSSDTHTSEGTQSVINSDVKSDDAVIVVDVGALNTRVGMAPRGMLKEEHSLITPQCVVQPWESAGEGNYALQNGVVVNWDRLEEGIEEIFNTSLQLESSLYSFLLCESQMMPPKQFVNYGEFLFELYDAKAVCFKDPEVLAALSVCEDNETLNNLSAILVDMGAELTKVTPVISGYPLTDFSEYIPTGGFDVDRLVYNEMQYMSYTKPQRCLNLKAAREGKERLSKTAENDEDFRVEAAMVASTCNEHSQTANYMYKSYIEGPEMYFNQNILRYAKKLDKYANTRFEIRTLPEVIFEVIQKCPIDYRRAMYKTVIVYGGMSLTPGMVGRIQNEVQSHLASNIYSARNSVMVETWIPSTKELRRHAAWCGGYLFAQQPIFDVQKICRKDYEEYGNQLLALKSKSERLKHYFLQIQ